MSTAAPHVVPRVQLPHFNLVSFVKRHYAYVWQLTSDAPGDKNHETLIAPYRTPPPPTPAGSRKSPRRERPLSLFLPLVDPGPLALPTILGIDSKSRTSQETDPVRAPVPAEWRNSANLRTSHRYCNDYLRPLSMMAERLP